MDLKGLELYQNVFYFRYINKIGGIETWFYQLAKKYKNKDIVIYYNAGDKTQIDRLKKYVRVLRYNQDEKGNRRGFQPRHPTAKGVCYEHSSC
jgi:flagellar basal body rod protein FlgC